MRVGIFFGGMSREREVSFSGAKTIFNALDRDLFDPIPVFIDGLGNFVKLDVRFLERDTIRSFYPSRQSLPDRYQKYNLYIESVDGLSRSEHIDLLNKIGTPINPAEFRDHIDFALLILHGPYGEDGTIQGMLDWYNVPYSGCSVLASSIGIDKELQRGLEEIQESTPTLPHLCLSKTQWMSRDKAEIFEEVKQKVGLPMVIKSPYQGSSIGVSILRKDNLESFVDAVHSSMFIKEVKKSFWQSLKKKEKKQYVESLIELDKSLGMPVVFLDDPLLGRKTGEIVYHHPDDLIEKLDDFFNYAIKNAYLSAMDSEEKILFEQIIVGKEFSCGVIQDENGEPVALPPTEIIPSEKGFDYEAKYKNPTEKVLPIRALTDDIRRIQQTCQEHFRRFRYNVCIRIDGFLTEDGQVLLIDTNTIPGMSPTSLIFRQAAELGLDPTRFLTYLVHTSLSERLSAGKRPHRLRELMHALNGRIEQKYAQAQEKEKRVILIPSYGDLCALALREARHIYTQLAANRGTEPYLVFVRQSGQNEYELYRLPISFLLKDSIEEILHDLEEEEHPILYEVRERGKAITQKFHPDFVPLPQKITPQELSQLSQSAYMPVTDSGMLTLKLRKELEQAGIDYHEA